MSNRAQHILIGLGGLSALALTALLVTVPGEDGSIKPPPAERVARATTTSYTAAASSPDEVAEQHAVYRHQEMMITLAPGADLARLAGDYDAEVLREVGRSGHALLRLPDGVAAADIAADERVATIAPNARIAGAKSDKKDKKDTPGRSQDKKEDDTPVASTATDTTTDATGEAPQGSGAPNLLWHLDEIGLPTSGDASGVVVAVLDTGVAYESDKIQGTSYAQAASMVGVDIVAPWDFVDGDSQPLDEHQHGTHIASLIAGQGDVPGVAPGVSLMPLRVLDEDNSGSELDLIEAITWAVDHGADVINMSLTFPPAYVPSQALRQAIQDAADAGVVMVAATGNDGRDDVPCWPAGSPQVISVAAFVPTLDSLDGTLSDKATAYSNLGTGVDLMAPGGDILVDHNGDGVVDGIVAETIGHQDPSETGLWVFEGTSQAAALVSGAAAWLIAEGASGEQVRDTLLYGSQFWGNNSFDKGYGAGGLDISTAISELGTAAGATPEYHVAMLAWPAQGEDGLHAAAQITVVMSDGSAPSDKLEVYGTAWGPEGAEQVSCGISKNAQTCTLKTQSSPSGDDLAWAIQIDAIAEHGVEIPRRPGAAMFASDGLEILLSAAADESQLKKAALALEWSEEEHDELGAIAEGYSIVNAGTGLASSPLGVVFLADAVPMGKAKEVSLDLDGTGLASSPLGLLSVKRVNIEGTGLASSPLGFFEQKLLVVHGTGLASSPLGLSALDIFAPGSNSIDAGLGLNGSAMLMSRSALVGASSGAVSASTEDLLSEGWVSTDGYEVGSLLIGSGAAAVGLSAEGDTTAGSHGGVALP